MHRLIRSSLIPLLFLLATIVVAAAENRGRERWEKDIAALEARDRANPPKAGSVLFVGSSSFQRWKTLAADFPQFSVVNHGFGGSTVTDNIFFFDRLVLPVRPRLGVFYAGGNDLNGGRTPEQVAAEIRAFAEKWHAALPTRKLIFTSLQLTPARWATREKIALTNAYIAAFCAADPRRVYVDLCTALLTPEGEARPELYGQDRHHLNAAGYAIWIKLLTPLLE